ncbi:Rv3235 family protein [Pseudonocardia sp. 73-21]|uniref:Rv3235 family protein n=1 Tax=Pseudonocardia sp. 73-21 TaxID=1895809 RepID=UPI0009608DE8|nr:Rv3235 family protein [Pseudonocardia sp. 73-21]OJY39521.1 MAG: hypothetical protein BGP03_30880 [Pseudonocardia sp. 73-21]
MTSALLERRSLPAPTTVERARPRLRRMRYEPESGATSDPVRARTETGPVDDGRVDVDPEAIRRALHGPLRLAMEVLDGRRPPAHLRRHFAPCAMRYWQVAAGQRRFRAPARLLRVLLCLPRTGAAEVSAVCEIDGRVRALAARFEQPGAGGPWRCTAVRLG